MMNKMRLSWIGFALLGATLSAQTPVFRRYTTADGLVQPAVHAIIQASNGLLWVGGEDGVSRFDGTTFRTYRQFGNLDSTPVSALGEDTQKRLWVGTRSGLYRYHLQSDGFELVGEPAGQVWAFACCEEVFYCLMADGKIFRLGDGWTWTQLKTGLSGNVATCLASDGPNLYVGTRTGSLLSAAGNKDEVKLTELVRLPCPLNGIGHSTEGLLLATEMGLYRLPRGAKKAEGPAGGTADARLLAAGQGPDGSIWCGGDSGVWTTSGASTARLIHQSDFPEHRLQVLFQDRGGDLWFGGARGLLCFSAPGVEAFGSPGGPGKDLIDGATWDPATRRLWVATAAGLFTHGQDGFKPGSIPGAFLRQNPPSLISAGRSGEMFFGTNGGGLLVHRAGKDHAFDTANGLPSADIVDLTPDSKGKLWVAMPHALAFIEGDKVHHLDLPAGATEAPFSRVLPWPDGTSAYVGTDGAGLFQYRSPQLTAVKTAAGGDPRTINDLLLQNSSFWVAAEEGLFVVDQGNSLRRLGRESGLPDTPVLALLPADKGDFWVIGRAGVARFDPATVRVSQWLLRPDELPSLRWVTRSTCTVDSGGNLWLGLPGGLYRVSAAARRVVPPSGGNPPLAFLDWAVLGRDDGRETLRRELNDSILPGEVQSVSLVFRVPQLRDPSSITVSTKLEGFDTDFSTPGNTGQRQYTHLPAGSYQFIAQVFADGALKNRTVLASFRVEPSMWLNPFYYFLALVLAAFAIYAGFRIRHRNLLKDFELLDSQLQAVSFELGKKNTLLAHLAISDELTGLYNRRFFLRALQQEIRRLARSSTGEGLALMLVDVDGLRLINDTFGTSAGDRVIQHVARCLKAGLRNIDISARFSGGEFIMILPLTKKEGARRAAEKIRLMVNAVPPKVDGHTIRCTISIGISALMSPVEFSNTLVLDLIRRGEAILKLAKSMGRNRAMVEGDL